TEGTSLKSGQPATMEGWPPPPGRREFHHVWLGEQPQDRDFVFRSREPVATDLPAFPGPGLYRGGPPPAYPDASQAARRCCGSRCPSCPETLVRPRTAAPVDHGLRGCSHCSGHGDRACGAHFFHPYSSDSAATA